MDGAVEKVQANDESQALATDADEALVEEIERAQAWEYAHSGCENMPAKTSPTALMKLLDAEKGKKAEAFVEHFDEESVQEKERAEKGKDTVVGSAYHAFLEHFDFARLDGVKENEDARLAVVEEALKEMQAQGVLGEEYLSVLQTKKLAEILQGEVFYRLRNVRIHKEQRFMAALPAREVLSVLGEEEGGGCPACDEDMLFQGAIDLLAVGDGWAEIIDYKYSQKGEEALRSAYAVQLRLYKMAVAKILHIPLEKVRCTLVNIYHGFELEVQ